MISKHQVVCTVCVCAILFAFDSKNASGDGSNNSSNAIGKSVGSMDSADTGQTGGKTDYSSAETSRSSSPAPATSSGGSSGGTIGTASGSGSSGTVGQPTGGVVEPDYSLPEWIKKEGIRAGYLYYYNNHRYAAIMKNAGFNTAIVKGWQFYLSQMASTLKAYQGWAQVCRKVGLHMIAGYNWQPQKEVFAHCRPVVFADGSEGVFACPLDDYFWREHLTNVAVKIAKISLEDSVSIIDGYFLDMEMYGTEELAGNKKDYSPDTCFCDFCFSRFIINRTQIKSLPPVSKDKRKAWLSQNGFLPDYYAYLTEQVEAKAEHLKNEVRAINPKLLFGVYPALTKTSWVQTAVMRAFGRNSYPVISFSTDTYGYDLKPWGADRIPADLPVYFEKFNINGIYVAGYLFRKYTSSEIQNNIIQSCQRSQGYWLFKVPQLVEDNIPKSEALAGGSQADYLQAIKNANAVPKTK